MRMLDNALDASAYPSPAARAASQADRAVGLGITGFQEALYQLRLGYGSVAAADFADRSMEAVAYNAILASTSLARERGSYAAMPGSKWSHGLLPLDTLALLDEERGQPVKVDRSSSLDWAGLREILKRNGIRHATLTAIGPAPEASRMVGVTDAVEPARRLLFPAGASAWNWHLVEDLQLLNLWDEPMKEELRRNQRSLQAIARLPQALKEIYRTAFEIEPRGLIECAARRQKWLDSGQPLNVYAMAPDLGVISEIYLLAWEQGLKGLRQLCLPENSPSQTQPGVAWPLQSAEIAPGVLQGK
jgi:ribonucleoside-diphosphate reductase alpha chain